MAVLNKRAIVTAIEMYGVTAIRLGRTLNPALDVLIKALFSLGEQGFAYDPNDLTTMYQDAAGTIPVTAAGQPVGLMLDKSKGLALGVELFNDSKAIIATAGSSRIEPNVYKITSSDGSAQSIEITGLPYGMLEVDLEILSVVSGSVRLDSLLNNTRIFSTIGKSKFRVLNTRGNIAFVRQATPTDVTLRINSIKQVLGNHAYQTTSAARPILQDAPRRIDFDTVDDKLITNLPAQLTGCTVIRYVPNVGTQILIDQTIPTPYNDNIDHCGLIVINRALTPSETSAITAEFNKRVGV